MTLIIDMASGTRCDEPARSIPEGASVTAARLEAPAPETGLTLHPASTTAAKPTMPAALRTCNLEAFLDDMD